MVASSSLGPTGIVGGGVNVQRSLHTQYHDEVPLSKTPNPQLNKWLPTAPGVCVHGVCVCVCVHLGWVKCRAQIQSMGHHTWQYVTSLSLKL